MSGAALKLSNTTVLDEYLEPTVNTGNPAAQGGEEELFVSEPQAKIEREIDLAVPPISCLGQDDEQIQIVDKVMSPESQHVDVASRIRIEKALIAEKKLELQKLVEEICAREAKLENWSCF